MGAICFNSFVDIKSAPELNFGFSSLQILKMSISETLENSKETGFSSGRKLLKSMSELSIYDACLGPMPEKMY